MVFSSKERALIVNALHEKARGDKKAAESLISGRDKPLLGGSSVRLAQELLSQAEIANDLADRMGW